MKDKNFGRYPDRDPGQQVGSEERRHDEIKPQQECYGSRGSNYRELNRARCPARVIDQMVGGALDKWG
jgi:hypothetical protein